MKRFGLKANDGGSKRAKGRSSEKEKKKSNLKIIQKEIIYYAEGVILQRGEFIRKALREYFANAITCFRWPKWFEEKKQGLWMCLMKGAISTRCCPTYILPLIGGDHVWEIERRGFAKEDRIRERERERKREGKKKMFERKKSMREKCKEREKERERKKMRVREREREIENVWEKERKSMREKCRERERRCRQFGLSTWWVLVREKENVLCDYFTIWK